MEGGSSNALRGPDGGGPFAIRGEGAKGSSSGLPRGLGKPRSGPLLPLLDERRAVGHSLPKDEGANAPALLAQQAPMTTVLRRVDTIV